MTRCQILSDLHLEFEDDKGRSFVESLPVAAPVLVLAGDVTTIESAEQVGRVFRWFAAKWDVVAFVPGNHEYYGNAPIVADDQLRRAAEPLFWCLNDRDCVTIVDCSTADSVKRPLRLVGRTLWFRETDDLRFRGLMTDFRAIRSFPRYVYRRHLSDLQHLAHAIQPGDVVVTHHLPHRRSIDPQFEGSPLNRFFLADDCANLVEKRGAALWVHGHTHHSCDYVVGSTRVVCNPRGYWPAGLNPNFDPALTVDV